MLRRFLSKPVMQTMKQFRYGGSSLNIKRAMVGSVLLLLIGVSLLAMMFLGKEPIKIIESAFLLILGYFFGHSKNNNK